MPSQSKKKHHRGRPSAFDEATYMKNRSTVERFFSMLKGGFRRFTIRYEIPASIYRALIHLACFIIHESFEMT
ncbi:MAG: transposase [Thaumarchaeota archaeon]|nr:transposase [Nitrososphaerota archaeon]